MVDPGNVTSVAGVKGLEGEKIAPDTVDAGGVNAEDVLRVPVYADNSNAIQEQESIWFNDGSGPNDAGYYGFDGGAVIGPFGQVSNPLEGTLDAGGNAVTNVGSFDALDGSTKVMNGIVNGAHPDFTTAQDALDWADANKYYKIGFPPGQYGPIAPHGAQHIFGTAHRGGAEFHGGTTTHAVDMTVNGAGSVTLQKIQAATDSGAGNPYNSVHIDGASSGAGHRIIQCLIGTSDNHGVNIVDSNGNPIRYNIVAHTHFSNNLDGDSVFLGSNSDRNLVLGNTSGAGWSVTNNGTKNVVTDNP